MELLCICVVKETVHGCWDERKDLLFEADDHAMEELPHSSMENLTLYWSIEHTQENMEEFGVNINAPTLLHGLLAREPLACSTGTNIRQV